MAELTTNIPNPTIQHLIQRHLSKDIRITLIKDILTLILITVFASASAFFLLPAIVTLSTDAAKNDVITRYIFQFLFSLCVVIFLIMFCLQLTVIIRHFRTFRATRANWTEYQYLVTASPEQLQDYLRNIKASLDGRERNIRSIRTEQDILRREYTEKINDLELQIQIEEKLIISDNLREDLDLIQQLITLYAKYQ